MDYTKVGGTQAGRAFSYNNYRYGFNDQEKDWEIGDYYSFEYRVHDPRLGRFLSVDPSCIKYPAFSGYAFCIDNALIVVDPDGKDIIVLCAPITSGDAQAGSSGHPTGHQAILIGNDNDGWNFYSFDGSPKTDNNGKTISDGKTVQHYSSLSAFAVSDNNTYKDNYDDGESYATSHTGPDGKTVLQRFKQGFRITTSTEVDAKMNKATKDYLAEAEYSIISSDDCTDVPRTALETAGLNAGEYTFYPTTIGGGVECHKNRWPEEKQREIEHANTGTDVDDQLDPAKVEIK